MWVGEPTEKTTAPADKTVDVLIPALNEEATVGRVIRNLPDNWFRRVVLVDNGSTDKTAERAKEAGADVVSEPVAGYGRACLTGLDYLRSEPPDIVSFIDADASDNPSEIKRILTPMLRDNVEFVLGSRTFGAGLEEGAMSPHAVAGNLFAAGVIWWLTGYRFTDLGPFRAIEWDVLEQIGMEDKDFGWTVEMQIKAARAGVTSVEVPVSYSPRRQGESKVSGSLAGSIRAGLKILRVLGRHI
jgi:glycosyltransferase involved in cell wall biosynthesis